MEEIKVGEYVRTREGYIAKVKEINDKVKRYWFDNSILRISGICCYDLDFEPANNYIVKHSSNIIDLIEKGDYVNGYLVVYDKSSDGYIEIAIGDDTEQGELLENEDIESIVTKEQFNQMKYIVGDE